MPNLDIKIVTTAEGQGANQAADDLKKVGAAAAGASKDSADLSDDLKRQVEASKLTAAATDQVETSIGKLIKGFKQLGHEVPIVGAALRALGNLWTLLAAVIGIFVVKIKEAIAVQEEFAKQSAELSLRLDPLLIRQTRAAQLQAEANEATRQHNRALAEQNTVLEKNELAIQAAADAMGRRHDATDKILDAEKELALAKAGDDPAAKAEVEKEFRARLEVEKGRAGQATIETANRKLRDTRAAGTEARAALPGARAAAEAAARASRGGIDEVEMQIKLAEEEMASFEKEALAGERGEDVPAKGPMGLLGGIDMTAQMRAKQGRMGMSLARQRIDRLLGKKTELETPAKAAAERVTALETQEKTANAALPGLQAAFEKSVADETSRHNTAVIVDALKADADALKAQAEEKKKATQALDKADKAMTEAVKQMADRHNLSTEVIMNVLRRQH